MGPIQRRAKHLETAISICLLIVLLIIALGIFIKQFDYNMGRFGITTTAAPESKIHSELNTLLPAGFNALSGIEVYNPENLYEKINGKAPLYTESGFKELFTRRFARKDDEKLGMEFYLFDMATAKNAFSVYSVQKRADASVLPDMRFAYRTSNALYFTHGQYYIELIGWSESTELFKTIIETARKIRMDLTIVQETDIAELALFPQDNLVADSTKLYLANTFGFEGLTDTFTARYKIDGEIITAFLTKRTDSKQARATAENYRRFLIENDAVEKETNNELLKGKIFNLYGTTEIVSTQDKFVVGIHQAENQQLAENLAVTLIEKLGNTAKNND